MAANQERYNFIRGHIRQQIETAAKASRKKKVTTALDLFGGNPDVTGVDAGKSHCQPFHYSHYIQSVCADLQSSSFARNC